MSSEGTQGLGTWKCAYLIDYGDGSFAHNGVIEGVGKVSEICLPFFLRRDWHGGPCLRRFTRDVLCAKSSVAFIALLWNSLEFGF